MKIIEIKRIIEKTRFFTLKLSEISEKCLLRLFTEKKGRIIEIFSKKMGSRCKTHQAVDELVFLDKNNSFFCEKRIIFFYG